MDPEVIVKTGTSYPSMHDVFYSKDKLQEIIENNWAVEIFWFPFNSLPFDLSNDELWVRTFNRVRTQETEKVVSHWFYKIKNAYDFISQETLRTVSPFIRAGDWCAPLIQWVSFHTLKHILYPRGEIYEELPNAIHFRWYPFSKQEYRCMRLLFFVNQHIQHNLNSVYGLQNIHKNVNA